jgi:hypothetical protein
MRMMLLINFCNTLYMCLIQGTIIYKIFRQYISLRNYIEFLLYVVFKFMIELFRIPMSDILDFKTYLELQKYSLYFVFIHVLWEV